MSDMTEKLCGVYLLYFNERLVYIGKSKDICSRLNQHRKHGRMFDEWSFIPVPAGEDEELDYVESRLINAFAPEQNRKLIDTGRGVSVDPIIAIERRNKEELEDRKSVV